MLTGYSALVQELGLKTPAPYVRSQIAGAVRRSEIRPDGATEIYPKKAAPSGDLKGHLLFAFKNEPTDLRVLAAALKSLGPNFVRDWVQKEPTGAYARKAWFLYEYLTGAALDLPNARTGVYADVLDPKRHIVGEAKTSTRHRVRDNLLGSPGFSPTIRRTPKLVARMEEELDKQAEALTQSVDPNLLRRAVAYLYTKETRSSFEIEREAPNPQREERFITALTRAVGFEIGDKKTLIELQSMIVDPRFAAQDWRENQNSVGETVSGYHEIVHLICPKPGDVPELMEAWAKCGRRLLSSQVDPVIAAAIIAFGFVFIHPFEDGNGRIHRFLLHSALAKRNFSPKDMIFPISVSIVRDMASYDAALETFSKPLLSLIDWHLREDSTLIIKGDTSDHYRYFDATPLAEYLYERVAETIEHDLPEELDFLGNFDRAYQAVRNIVDMPNNRISLFIRLCMSNGGNLSKSKRKLFSELTDTEIKKMESAMRLAAQNQDSE